MIGEEKGGRDGAGVAVNRRERGRSNTARRWRRTEEKVKGKEMQRCGEERGRQVGMVLYRLHNREVKCVGLFSNALFVRIVIFDALLGLRFHFHQE